MPWSSELEALRVAYKSCQILALDILHRERTGALRLNEMVRTNKGVK